MSERRASREFEATEFVSFAVAYLEAVLGRDHPTVVAGHRLMEKMVYGPIDSWMSEVERAMKGGASPAGTSDGASKVPSSPTTSGSSRQVAQADAVDTVPLDAYTGPNRRKRYAMWEHDGDTGRVDPVDGSELPE